MLRAGRIVVRQSEGETEASLARPDDRRWAARDHEASGAGEVVFRDEGRQLSRLAARVRHRERLRGRAQGEIVGVAGISGQRSGAPDGGSPRAKAPSPTRASCSSASPSASAPVTRRRLSCATCPSSASATPPCRNLSSQTNTYLTHGRRPRRRLHPPGRRPALHGRSSERFHVRLPSPQKHAGGLSGGNLQKKFIGSSFESGRAHRQSAPPGRRDVGAAPHPQRADAPARGQRGHCSSFPRKSTNSSRSATASRSCTAAISLPPFPSLK